MDFSTDRHIGDILKERNIVLKGADAATREGYTQVPSRLPEIFYQLAKGSAYELECTISVLRHIRFA
jgi:hypothetical protein